MLGGHIVEVIAFKVGLSEAKIVSSRVRVGLDMGYVQVADFECRHSAYFKASVATHHTVSLFPF